MWLTCGATGPTSQLEGRSRRLLHLLVVCPRSRGGRHAPVLVPAAPATFGGAWIAGVLGVEHLLVEAQQGCGGGLWRWRLGHLRRRPSAVGETAPTGTPEKKRGHGVALLAPTNLLVVVRGRGEPGGARGGLYIGGGEVPSSVATARVRPRLWQG